MSHASTRQFVWKSASTGRGPPRFGTNRGPAAKQQARARHMKCSSPVSPSKAQLHLSDVLLSSDAGQVEPREDMRLTLSTVSHFAQAPAHLARRPTTTRVTLLCSGRKSYKTNPIRHSKVGAAVPPVALLCCASLLLPKPYVALHRRSRPIVL